MNEEKFSDEINELAKKLNLNYYEKLACERSLTYFLERKYNVTIWHHDSDCFTVEKKTADGTTISFSAFFYDEAYGDDEEGEFVPYIGDTWSDYRYDTFEDLVANTELIYKNLTKQINQSI